MALMGDIFLETINAGIAKAAIHNTRTPTFTAKIIRVLNATGTNET